MKLTTRFQLVPVLVMSGGTMLLLPLYVVCGMNWENFSVVGGFDIVVFILLLLFLSSSRFYSSTSSYSSCFSSVLLSLSCHPMTS